MSEQSLGKSAIWGDIGISIINLSGMIGLVSITVGVNEQRAVPNGRNDLNGWNGRRSKVIVFEKVRALKCLRITAVFVSSRHATAT